MRKTIVSLGAVLGMLAWPLATYAQAPGGSAAPSATTKPMTEAAPGAAQRVEHEGRAAADEMLSTGEAAKLRRYVAKEKTPSVKMTEKLAVGTVLPRHVELHAVPAEIGLAGDVRYSVVNERIVLVEAKTRKVTEIVN